MLVGRWDLDRRVTDRLTGITGRMRGTLRVSHDADRVGEPGSLSPLEGLRWEEEGTLRWEGTRLHASRNLALRVVDGEWWMTFEGGGLFHRWRPGELLEHPCGADRYVGRLDLDPSGGRMRIVWEVNGPSKRQLIFTRYRSGRR